MKKIVAGFLITTLLISLFSFSVLAEKGINVLSSIDDIDLLYDNSINLTYTYNTEKITLPIPLYENHIDYLLEFFSNKNLMSADTDVSGQITDEEKPQKGTLVVTQKGNISWNFAFDEAKVLVTKTDLMSREIYLGWFTYKDKNIYNELIEIIESVCDEYYGEKQPSQYEPEENQTIFNNFKIIYSMTFPHTYYNDYNEVFEWGICSYETENTNEPVTVIYNVIFNDQNEKIFGIEELNLIKDNIVTFNEKRVIIFNSSTSTDGIEEMDDGYALLYPNKLQINITDDIKISSVAYTHKNNSGEILKQIVDMSTVKETGTLPSGIFSSKNNVDFKVNHEEESTERLDDQVNDETKVEESEKEEITEDIEKFEETEEKDDKDTNETIESTEPRAIEFADVPETHWAYNEVQSFSQRNIVLGYGNGYFGVNDSITYEHFALLLQRLFDYDTENKQSIPSVREDIITSTVKALKIDVSNADESIIEKTFNDCANLKPENKKYIAKAVEIGLVVGYDGKLNPEGNLTRAETVVLLARAELM